MGYSMLMIPWYYWFDFTNEFKNCGSKMMAVDVGKRFLMELENTIGAANREVIHNRIPALTPERILPFAISVARLRARYLEAAFKFSDKEHGEALDETEINELRRHREMYEEAREAFGALTHAIERGYVDINSGES